MKRIKYCLNCRAENPSSEMLCIQCGADISRLETEFYDENAKGRENYEKNRPVYFKICTTCGKLCTADTDLCPSCGAETGYDIVESYKIPDSFLAGIAQNGISDIKMVIARKGVLLKTVQLSNGLCAFGRNIIGEFGEKIGEIKYISELHCLIMNEKDSLKLIDLSVNGTFVNGKRVLEAYEISVTACANIVDEGYLSLSFE